MFKSIKRFLSVVLISALVSSFAVFPVNAAEIDGWNVQYNGGVNATVSIDTSESYSGSASMKVVNNSPVKPNVYVMPTARLKMEKDKKYRISAKVKSINSTRIYFCVSPPWATIEVSSIGSTFDWTNFQYTYVSTVTGDVNLGFILDGPTEGVWFDEVKVIDLETNKNLITNSGFEPFGDPNSTEEPAEEPAIDVADGTLLEVYNDIKSSETFSKEAMEKVRGAFKYMPVYAAENITIDGDISDWESYPALTMPTLPTQYQVYMKDGKAKDVEAECKFAQDEENFYFMIAVKDDNYVYFSGENDYWKGDSIQLTISTPDETYGNELGLVHNPDTGEGEIYGSGFNDEQKQLMTLKTSQKDNITYYEFKFPWVIKYWGTRPSQLLFNFLINDNDGNGRRYCAELAPGISEGKTNVLFPMLEILDGKKDWYAWIQGDRQAITEEETVYECYIVNSGEEKTFTLTNPITNETEDIVIPGGTGVRRAFPTTYTKAGTYTVAAKIECNGEETVSSFTHNVERKAPDAEYAQGLADKLRKNAEILKELLDKCEKKSIPTDYETLDYSIIEKFAVYVEQDIADGDFSRIYYTEETTDKLFEEAKASLEAYLAGEKEALLVPHYVTSEMKIDGLSTIATAEVDGIEEERPVFFVGYGHFGTAKGFIPVFNDWGVNTIQQGFGPSELMSRKGSWTIEVNNDPKHEIIQSGEVVKEGKSSFGVIYNDQLEAHHFVTAYQNVPVTPGRTYEFTGWIKSEYAEQYWVSPDGWNSIKYMSGENDWKQFKIEYKAPEGKTTANVRIAVEDVTRGLYFDDFSFKEKGTDKELLKDGGFETSFYALENYAVDFDSSAFKYIIDVLEKADENNVAVSFLFSPHSFINTYAQANGININTSGFLNYNVNAPEARALIEKCLRELIPEIKDYDSLNSICLSNEPQFEVMDCGDFYMEDWCKYLSEVYNGDINALNKAYGTNYTAFEGISFEHSAAVPAKQYDYKIFNDKVFADWHKFMADIIREIAPDIPLYSKPMGYTASSNARSVLLNNGTGYGEYYDFYDMHGSDYWNYYDDEFKPLVKEMWYDYQISFGDPKPAINTEDHVIPDRSTNYNLEHSDYVAQDVWQGAVHGRASTVMWVWQRYKEGESTDFIGSILYRPDAISKVGKVSLDLNRLSYEVTAVQNDEREIGIIYSDASMLNSTVSMAASYEAYAAASFNGKRSIFISDYNLDKMDSCKLVIVPDVKFITKELLNKIKSYIENGGKVIVLGENTLTLDEHSQEHDMSVVNYIMNNSQVVATIATPAGYEKPQSEELCGIVREALKSLGLYNVSVIDTATGKPAMDVEYNVGVYDGKLLVNLSNFGEEKSVQIYVGDTLVTEAEDLRSGNMLTENITVGKYNVAFLKTNITNPFIDTYGHWAEKEIVNLKNESVVNGVSETRYNPNGTTTRAEFLALLMRASKLGEGVYKNNISDVASDDWFAGNVAKALEKGIIREENFKPGDKITREEMCEMLVACCEVTDGALSPAESLSLSDIDKITNTEFVSKAVNAGLMQGYENGAFVPEGNATRAEAAAVINRYLNK